jgi:hypothetical protein
LPEAQIPYEPAALSGAAVLVTRAAFEEVDGFEEAFLNGSEDVDLSLKLWAAGYHCRYEPRATIVHLEGASRGKDIDGAPNDRLLRSRWNHRVGAVPRYDQPLPPTLDLRWQSANSLETLVKRSYRAALAVHAGARVVENQPAIARVASALDRRARLSIEHRFTGETCDVVWCAPETPDDALTVRARRASRYWVPTKRCADLLLAVGIAPNAISLTRPGFAVRPYPAPRPIESAVLVHRQATTTSRIAPLMAALTRMPVDDIIVQRADGEALARIANASLVVFADPGDAWGLLGGTALAGGALVVAPKSSPFLEVLPGHACLVADDTAGLVDALHMIHDDPYAFIDYGTRAARSMSRVASDIQAGRRIRELGRALVHGVVDPRTLAMNDAIAATMSEPGVLDG